MSEDIPAAKVALIGPVFPYRGGIAHYTTSLARTFQEQGHQLLLVSFKRQYPLWLYPGDTDKDPSAQGFEADNPNYWIDSLNPITWFRTFWRVRAFGPQVIVLQWWTTFFAPLWLTIILLNRFFLAAPIVFICHNVLPHEERRLDRWIAWLLLRSSSHVIVQSDTEYELVKKILSETTVSIVPHPTYDILATDVFSSRTANSIEARHSFGLESEQFVLLFFGIIRAYKGLPELLHAFARVANRFPNTTLLIAGEFWEDKEEYTSLIHELDLEHVVQIDDRYIPNEDVAFYYAAADLLVAPYRRHTGSGVIQVATALDLPVITLNSLTQSSGIFDTTLYMQRIDYLVDRISTHIQMSRNCGSIVGFTNSQVNCLKSRESYPDKQIIKSTWTELAVRILDTIYEP